MNFITNGNFKRGILFPWISDRAKITEIHGNYCAVLPSEIGSTIYQIVPVLSFNKYKLIFSLSSNSYGPLPSIRVNVGYRDIQGSTIYTVTLIEISSDQFATSSKCVIFEEYIHCANFNAVSLIIEFEIAGKRLSKSDLLINDVKLISTIEIY